MVKTMLCGLNIEMATLGTTIQAAVAPFGTVCAPPSQYCSFTKLQEEALCKAMHLNSEGMFHEVVGTQGSSTECFSLKITHPKQVRK